jgi:hypothetical protein
VSVESYKLLLTTESRTKTGTRKAKFLYTGSAQIHMKVHCSERCTEKIVFGSTRIYLHKRKNVAKCPYMGTKCIKWVEL